MASFACHLPILRRGAFLLMLLAGACEQKPADTARDRPQTVVLVLIDTLRRDAVGAYEPASKATPHLDRIASEGLVLDYAIAASPWTKPSLASLFTGLHPSDIWPDTEVMNHYCATLTPDAPTLATIIRGEGFRTVALIDTVVIREGSGFLRGFDVVEPLWMKGGQVETPSIGVTPAELRVELQRVFADAGDKPLFLYLHLFHPHEPYGDPATQPELVVANRERLHELYLEDVALSDRCLGVLDELLESSGRKDALLTVLADHGEEFGEHDGQMSHGWTFYNQAVHVPWIVRWPGRLAPGSRFAGTVRHVDLIPTFCEWIDLPLPPHYRGRSFAADLSEAPSEPIVAMSEYTMLTPLNGRAWQDGKLKAGYTILGASPPFVFDLEKDPGEHDNLVDPQEAASHVELILELQKGIRTDPLGLSIGPEEMLDPEVEEHLRSIGYGHLIKRD